jgi:hypothetical protein
MLLRLAQVPARLVLPMSNSLPARSAVIMPTTRCVTCQNSVMVLQTAAQLMDSNLPHTFAEIQQAIVILLSIARAPLLPAQLIL